MGTQKVTYLGFDSSVLGCIFDAEGKHVGAFSILSNRKTRVRTMLEVLEDSWLFKIRVVSGVLAYQEDMFTWEKR